MDIDAGAASKKSGLEAESEYHKETGIMHIAFTEYIETIAKQSSIGTTDDFSSHSSASRREILLALFF